MEEVDDIIIEALKNMNCEIDEELRSLKEFTPDLIVNAIACCLESIKSDIKLPRKLPPSMSLRLNIATNLAEHIKELGFRGDMGYQSILYGNEIEVRRILMFLIERLPRETIKVVANEEIGYVPKLIREIGENVQLSLEKPWVPSSIVKLGVREYNNNRYFKQTCGFSQNLSTVSLCIPKTKSIFSEDLKQYWTDYLPDVVKQCSSKDLLPSLLFNDNKFMVEHLNLKATNIDELETEKIEIYSGNSNILENKQKINIGIAEAAQQVEVKSENKVEKLIENIANHKKMLLSFQTEYQNTNSQLQQLQSKLEEEENQLKVLLSNLKIKSKTLTVLTEEENIMKLKGLVENGNERLIELANQWNEVQTPLLEQYKSLKSSLSSQELKIQEEQDKIQKTREKNKSYVVELKDKSVIEQQLMTECEKMHRNTNRSAYTRRILEIIGNIKKQNDEIQKILKDTKEVQKEINNLNGQLDRSFTLSDELIFRDAKQDETARKAYKLLANLHNDCSQILQAISNLGLAERESRNLQEQVEAEINKEIGAKLERVQNDLQEVRKETALLIKK